jgi:hypothetical protein
MTIATVSDIPSTSRRMAHTNIAVKRQWGYTLPQVNQAFFPIFGVLLCAVAMMIAFLLVQSTLLIGP